MIRAHGESGVTARLQPITIDGLVYASSMVVLYAARHRLAVPALARWLLTLGIAANVAHGWSALAGRRRRGRLARGQPGRQLRVAALARPDRRRWQSGPRASSGPGRQTASGPPADWLQAGPDADGRAGGQRPVVRQ